MTSVSKSHYICVQVTGGEAALVESGFIWCHSPLGMFPIFLKRAADVLATRLSVVFLWFIRLGSFPACWRLAIVTPQFRKVHLLPQWPITDQFPEHLHILPDVFKRLMSATFDAKMTFEKCLRSVSRVAAGRFGIMRKS